MSINTQLLGLSGALSCDRVGKVPDLLNCAYKININHGNRQVKGMSKFCINLVTLCRISASLMIISAAYGDPRMKRIPLRVV